MPFIVESVLLLGCTKAIKSLTYVLVSPFTSCQLGDLVGGSGERVVLCGGGEVGGDELLLLLGEKVLPVSRLIAII
jgi:hypothetical protein